MTEEKAVAVRDEQAALLERVVIHGDLSKLSEAERVVYYRAVCESIGVNPLTRPFDYLNLGGKLILYANRNCTDQLRANRHISVAIVGREKIEDVYVVTARASDPSGRSDESVGAVSIGNLKGDALANGLMKAETKSKRRATLSLVGLSMLDETEIETIRDARRVTVEELAAPTPAAGYLKPESPIGYIAPEPEEPPTLDPLAARRADFAKYFKTKSATAVADFMRKFETSYGVGYDAARLEQLDEVWEVLHQPKAVAP